MFGLSPFNRTNDSLDLFNDLHQFFPEEAFDLSPQDAFKIDVQDNGQAYVVEAEVPGIKKEEINLDYRNDTLYIGVTHQEDFNDDRPNYIHRERRSTSMQRGIYLKDIDLNGVDAQLEDGVLRITAPKLYTSSDYRIDVR